MWLVIAAVLFLGGVGGCSGLMYSGLHKAVHVQTGDTSGSLQLDAGKYTVYSTGPTVTIFAPNGGEVRLNNYSGDVTITTDGTKYRAVSTFTADTAGSYRINLNGSGSVAIGHGLAHSAAKIGIGFGIGAVGVVAAIAIIAVVIARREKHQMASYGYQPGPGRWDGGPPPGSYPYQQPTYGPPPNQGAYPPPGHPQYPPNQQGSPPTYPPAQ
jgi:hypothetical protein